MATTAKQTKTPPERSKSLEKAVDREVDQAVDEAKTGNVETVPQEDGGPMVDLPTGARSHLPE